MSALRTQILAAVKAAVESLALTGVKGVFVRKGKRASAKERYPCVVVRRSPRPDVESRLCFETDSPSYPVEVVFAGADPLGDDAATGQYDDWYQAITRAVMEPQTLRALLPAVLTVQVQPLQEIDQDDAAYQRIFGGVLLLVSTVEPRGAGA